MKKMLLKRIACLLLSVSLAVSLVACGDADKESTQSKEESTKANGTTEGVGETSGSTEESTEADVAVYPLDTDMELSVWAGNGFKLASTYSTWEDSPVHTGLMDRTGVKIDWRFLVKGANIKESYNLIWVDKELPDIVYHNITSAEAVDYISEGLIWDLTDYVEEYAPNFYAYITDEANIREYKAITTADGKFYKIPAITESTYNSTYIGPIIRQDWLDECNLEQPVTIEDWENVLMTFKDKYGAKLCFRWNYAVNTGFFASGFDALGFLSGVAVNDENKVVLPETTAEYYEMIKVIADWWSKGLIDEDCVTIDNNAVRTKALNNETGVIFTTMSQFSNIIGDAENQGTSANWVAASYARTEKGAPTSVINISSPSRATGYGAVITTGATEEEMKLALQWMDYAFTEEGSMFFNFGEEGVSYEYDENGNPQFTKLVTEGELGLDGEAAKYTFAGGTSFGIQMSSLVAAKNHPTVAEAPYVWTENTDAVKHDIPSLSLTEDENERKNAVSSALNTYMSEEIIKFCSGDRPLSEWNDFQAKLVQMGVNDYVAVHQSAYERYLAD